MLIFGSTVHAVSTVLTVFFIGLALGSWFFGRWIDGRESQGLRTYGWMEIWIGLYAFLTPILFNFVQGIALQLWRQYDYEPTTLTIGTFIGACLVLLIPTTMMGATFPVLSRYLIRSVKERGSKIADLYGLNTLGAMLGTLGVYFVALPVLGWQRTLVCAGVLNLGIGVMCLIYDRKFQYLHPVGADTGTQTAEKPTVPAESLWAIFLAFALSGFAAMAYEVAWTRALSLVLGSSIYAFCLMLVTFLGGMALGTFAAKSYLERSEPKLSTMVRIEWILGALGVFSIILFGQLPDLFVGLWPLYGENFSTLVVLQMMLSAFVMFIPAALMGYLFPLVSAWVTQHYPKLGRRLGALYAINTVGGVLGSFVTGFISIPLLGLPWAIWLAATANVASGVLFQFKAFGYGVRSWLGIVVSVWLVVVGGALYVVPRWQPEVMTSGAYLIPTAFQNAAIRDQIDDSEMVYYKDSLNATVSVHEDKDGTLYMKVGGKTDASNGLDMGTQLLSAHLPLIFHPEAKKVLVVGLGSGVTAGAAGQHDVDVLHTAEIDPAVVEGARYFKDYNFNVHEDPRSRIFVADGRNYLMATQEVYDVVISEPSNPWIAGLAYLFTHEYYELVKTHLAEDGIMCQWVQLYGMFPDDLKLFLKTFNESFPHVLAFSSVPGDLLIVGSQKPFNTTYARLHEAIQQPKVKSSLSWLKIHSPETLLALFVFSDTGIKNLTAGIDWLHRDDQPWLEFSSPKAMYASKKLLTQNYSGLDRFKEEPSVFVSGLPQPWPRYGDHVPLAHLWNQRGEISREMAELEKVVDLGLQNPEHLMDLALAYTKLNRPLQAKAMYQKVIAVRPLLAEPYQALAELALKEAAHDEAIQWYEAAVRARADMSPWWWQMGKVYHVAKDYTKAAEYYQKAMDQGWQRPEQWASYCHVLSELNQWAAIAKILEQVKDANQPPHPAWYFFAGKLALAQENPMAALEAFDFALRLEPERAETYYHLALAYRMLDEPVAALGALKRVLRSQPYHVKAAELYREME